MTAQRETTPLGVSTVQVTNGPGRSKLVHLPLTDDPVAMGVRDEVADHYGLPPSAYEPTTTTLDYLVGAVVACLTGTFGGRLAPLGQDTSSAALVAEGTGTLVVDSGVIRILTITVNYTLKLSDGVDEARVRRAHETHARYCPAARSVGEAIELVSHLRTI